MDTRLRYGGCTEDIINVLFGVIIIDEMEIQKLMEKSIDFWSEEKKKAEKEKRERTDGSDDVTWMRQVLVI